MSWLPDLLQGLGALVLGVAGVLALVWLGEAAPRAFSRLFRGRRR